MDVSQAPLHLNDDLLAMMRRGVSVIVSACSLDFTPSVMRAVGSQMSPDGSRITVFLARGQSRQLLQDVASTGRVAVVFSEPYSHRTVQVKARHVTLREACDEDRPVLEAYLASMQHELSRVGFGADFVRAVLAYRLDDVVALAFAPEQAFDQTPGPRAGQSLPVGQQP
jgi:hypothetical protein